MTCPHAQPAGWNDVIVPRPANWIVKLRNNGARGGGGSVILTPKCDRPNCEMSISMSVHLSWALEAMFVRTVDVHTISWKSSDDIITRMKTTTAYWIENDGTSNSWKRKKKYHVTAYSCAVCVHAFLQQGFFTVLLKPHLPALPCTDQSRLGLSLRVSFRTQYSCPGLYVVQ